MHACALNKPASFPSMSFNESSVSELLLADKGEGCCSPSESTATLSSVSCCRSMSRIRNEVSCLSCFSDECNMVGERVTVIVSVKSSPSCACNAKSLTIYTTHSAVGRPRNTRGFVNNCLGMYKLRNESLQHQTEDLWIYGCEHI